MPTVLGKNKALSNITVFTETFSCIQYFMIMESVFHSDCYRDLILGRNCIFTRKYIEIRKSFTAYRAPFPPPRVPTKAFACICVHIFCTIYENGVFAHGFGGAGGGVVYGPKTMIEQVKMLCMSTKEEITKNDFYITNFLKMVITCISFAVFLYGNWQLLQHLFVHQKNNVLVI